MTVTESTVEEVHEEAATASRTGTRFEFPVDKIGQNEDQEENTYWSSFWTSFSTGTSKRVPVRVVVAASSRTSSTVLSATVIVPVPVITECESSALEFRIEGFSIFSIIRVLRYKV